MNREYNEISELFFEQVSQNRYGSEEQYFEHIFQQYKTIVDAADKISNRRNLANSFFLSINTFFITFISFSYDNIIANTNQKWILICPLIMSLILCYLWWRLLKSYRQLNSAKYQVIIEYEKRLPSSPYWTEWKILGEGKSHKLYKPLTDIENKVPVIIGLIYITIVSAILFS